MLSGLSYISFERIYKQISVTIALALVTFFMFLIMLAVSYFRGALGTDLATIASSRKLTWLVAAGVATAILGGLLIFSGIAIIYTFGK